MELKTAIFAEHAHPSPKPTTRALPTRIMVRFRSPLGFNNANTSLIGTEEIPWRRTRWPCCDLVANNISYRLDVFPMGLVYLHDWVPFACLIIMPGTKPNLNGESVAANSACPFGAINQSGLLHSIILSAPACGWRLQVWPISLTFVENLLSVATSDRP